MYIETEDYKLETQKKSSSRGIEQVSAMGDKRVTAWCDPRSVWYNTTAIKLFEIVCALFYLLITIYSQSK